MFALCLMIAMAAALAGLASLLYTETRGYLSIKSLPAEHELQCFQLPSSVPTTAPVFDMFVIRLAICSISCFRRGVHYTNALLIVIVTSVIPALKVLCRRIRHGQFRDIIRGQNKSSITSPQSLTMSHTQAMALSSIVTVQMPQQSQQASPGVITIPIQSPQPLQVSSPAAPPTVSAPQQPQLPVPLQSQLPVPLQSQVPVPLQPQQPPQSTTSMIMSVLGIGNSPNKVEPVQPLTPVVVIESVPTPKKPNVHLNPGDRLISRGNKWHIEDLQGNSWVVS